MSVIYRTNPVHWTSLQSITFEMARGLKQKSILVDFLMKAGEEDRGNVKWLIARKLNMIVQIVMMVQAPFSFMEIMECS